MRNAVRMTAMKRAALSRIAGKNGQKGRGGRQGGKDMACPPRPCPRPRRGMDPQALPAFEDFPAMQAILAAPQAPEPKSPPAPKACRASKAMPSRAPKGHAEAAGIGAGLALLAGLPARALAASASLGDMSDSLKAEFAKFGPMLKAGFALAGFFLVGLGLWQLYALSQQPGRPKSGAVMAIVVGACLLACATIAQMTSGSLAAGDPELSSIGL